MIQINNDLEMFKKYNNKVIRDNLSIDYYNEQSENSLEYNYNNLIKRIKEIIGDKYA